MPRRSLAGRQVSPFAPVEEANAIQKCCCSVFLPGSQQAIPQYVASAFLSGDIRIHDTQAITQSAQDGIAATHFCSFTAGTTPVVQMKPMQTKSRTLLLCLEECRNLNGISLGVAPSVGEGSDFKSQSVFQLEHALCPSVINCFTVDDVHKRVFTGGFDGTWLCWDLERLSSVVDATPFLNYRAHRTKITDGDYCNNLLASASEDGSVCVWDIRSQTCISAFDPATGKHLPLNQSQRLKQCSNEASLSVRFDKSGRHVVASSRQKRITVWNIRSDTAQCSFHTDRIPYLLDTSDHSIFFSSADECLWRYSMFNAQMQCFQTSTSGINHLHIDREQQQTIVISGGADTVELLSLEGMSLGKATGRKEPVAVPEPFQDISPAHLSLALARNYDPDATPTHSPFSPQYSPDVEEMCVYSGSEMVTDEDDYEDEYVDEEEDYDMGFPVMDENMNFSSDDLEDADSDFGEDDHMNDAVLHPLIPTELGEEPLEAYGFTSDSDVSPRYAVVVPPSQEFSNCEFSTSQSEDVSSEEEAEEEE